ncbi:hypothetical protein G7Y79_00059g091920 [Physcia stellaris]|nr:hypothetical protein G7Y79_00059g091920 [Physcia stellaris]
MSSSVLLVQLLGSIAIARVDAAPQCAPLFHRSTNTTLSPPSSFDDEVGGWQKNIYVLQLTRVVLFIFLAVLVHFVYRRCRGGKQPTRAQAEGTDLTVPIDGLITGDDIVGEAEGSIEVALISMALGPILGVGKQPDSLRPPSPVYQPLSIRVSGRRNAAGIKDAQTIPDGVEEATITWEESFLRIKAIWRIDPEHWEAQAWGSPMTWDHS